MSLESTRADLLALEREHHADHDGGYCLVSALCQYRRQMLADTSYEWDQVLIDWVRNQPARFWGVALEALAQSGNTNVNKELSDMLREPDRGTEWREYVANALIRRGFVDKVLKDTVEYNAKHMSPMGLPNLALLWLRVPEVLPVVVACIVEAIASNEHKYVESNVPPFVHAAADATLELLIQLVQQVYMQDNKAGIIFTSMIVEYIKKPFVIKRFGNAVIAELVDKLQKQNHE